MLAGGYAVIHYGYRRTNGGMNHWIKPDNQNKQKLMNAFQDLGFGFEDLNELNVIDFTKHLAFSLGDEPFKVDFMTFINMVNWEEADKI